MKRFIACFVSFIMLFGCSMNVYAADEFDVPPEEIDVEEYVYTASVGCYLDISNNEATCTSMIEGYSEVTRIAVTQYLQKWNGSEWQSVAIWSDSYNLQDVTYVNYKSSLTNGTYRVKTFGTIYCGNNYENITIYSAYDYC